MNNRFDKEGYLIDFSSWQEDDAKDIAKNYKIKLTKDHWQIIYYLRDFYLRFNNHPLMRLVIKQLPIEKRSSTYFYQLFLENPMQISSKISGLPKPKNCL